MPSTVFSLVFLSFVVYTTQALSPPGPSCTNHYTVKSGDTCNKIEKAIGLTAGTILSLNRVVNNGCTNLWPGQNLCISASSLAPPQNTCAASTVTLPGQTITSTATVASTLTPVTVTAPPVTVTQPPNTVTVTSSATVTVTTTALSATYYGCPVVSKDSMRTRKGETRWFYARQRRE